MKILFYFGHPSQYLFVKNSVRILREKGFCCDFIIKSKDILEQLLFEDNESFINILPEGRKSGKIGIIIGLIKRDLRLFRLIRGIRYDLFIGTDPSLAHVGFLKRIPVITVLEDDINIIPELAHITFPFTSLILTPEGCKTGKYEKETVHYRGYMKLAYLHPNYFTKKPAIQKQPYFLIRISKLEAYHDGRIKGLTLPLLLKIISSIIKKGSVYISSEGIPDKALERYKLNIKPSEMQQVLANATMLISDSQSMTMEAAMLGIPSIRFSDFTGRIAVLEELEHKYKLTFGIRTNSPEMLFYKINEILSLSDLKATFENRRQRMLADKIDVTALLVWFIENYPDSAQVMRKDPEYQERFK